MVDKQKLVEQLRKLKKQIQNDPQVMALYDTDGDGNISGEEWEKARETVIAFMKATGSGSQTGGEKGSGAAGATGMAIAGAAGAAESVFGQIKERAGQSGPLPDGTLWTERVVVVKQEVSTTELMTNFDDLNRYKFYSKKGKELAKAVQYYSSGIRFTAMRPPFKMRIAIHGTPEILNLDRHCDFDDPQMEVSSNDSPVGVIIEKDLSHGNHYRLTPDEGDRELIVPKRFLSYTFPIMSDSRQVGSIEKKWGGFLKEAFTQADNFRISFFDPRLTPTERKLIVATVILIDMDRFEKSKGKSEP